MITSLNSAVEHRSVLENNNNHCSTTEVQELENNDFTEIQEQNDSKTDNDCEREETINRVRFTEA